MRRTTIVALILLRLVIGWHFLFEGWHKIHLWLVGERETSKPFTSEVYFREATGPLGPYMRDKLPNPDADALARLTPKKKPTDAASWSPKDAVPDAVAAEWDAYPDQLLKLYDLSPGQLLILQTAIDKKKTQLGIWLTTDRSGLIFIPEAITAQFNVVPALKPFNRTYPSGTLEEPMTTPEKLAYYHSLLEESDFWKHKRSEALRKPVDKSQQQRLRTEITAIRQDLLADLDKFTASLKDDMAEVIRKPLTTFSFWDKGDPHEEVVTLLAPLAGDAPVPEAIAQKYEAYHDLFLKTYRVADAHQKELARNQVDHAKEETRKWLASEGLKRQLADYQKKLAEFSAREKEYPKQYADYVAAQLRLFQAGQGFQVPYSNEGMSPPVKPAVERDDAYKVLVAGYDKQTSDLKKGLGLVLDSPMSKAYPPEPTKPFREIDRIDLITMWTLTIAGALLLLGLFPRLGALAAMVFLALTYLTYPPFPWLPAPPIVEGDPLYVNKNAVEFFALLVLLTVPSGRWFGLDALIYWFFQRKPRPESVTRSTPDGFNGHRAGSEAVRLQSNR
jgi:uncharacterized membrane protein YphA (DoxX/SURF4 family)